MRLPPVSVLALAVLVGCAEPLLDEPGKVRAREVLLPPLYTSSRSADGTSYDWNALFWLVGRDVEATRSHARALPFYWHDDDPPYRERTLWFPFWYERHTANEEARFWSILYGYEDSPEVHSDYVLLPLFYSTRSKVSDYHRSGLLFLYDWKHDSTRNDVTFLSLLGLVTLFHGEFGLPPEGETVPALGRESSRRFELGNILGLITLFGYDDVGDRRELRAFTLFSSEVLSPLRSWRGRGDDPFVREWVFPLYMNVGDRDGGWYYVGPLWGGFRDTASGHDTQWWLAGLLARTQAPEGDTWRVLGIPVSSP